MKGIKVFRTLFFLPTVVPLVANAVLWVRLLNPQQGLMQRIPSRTSPAGAVGSPGGSPMSIGRCRAWC